MEMVLNNGFCEMTQEEIMVADGGVITLTVLGVTLTGAKAVAAIAGGISVLAGAGSLGFYLGYK